METERHLSDLRQLTFGGENAEAYWSPDGRKLIFQATPRGARCDQEYVLDLESGDVKMVSTGKGRTTCGYFDYPEGKRILFSSTHAARDSCPPPPDRSHGYVWAIYDSYDIYEARPDGSGLTPLIRSPGYDAEATWCHGGGKFVFTSTRDGDLDLYVRDDAGKVKRMTDTPGYDGGAFFSPDARRSYGAPAGPRGPSSRSIESSSRKACPAPLARDLPHEGRRHRRAAAHEERRRQFLPDVSLGWEADFL